jgi:hypothetical protein
MALRHYQGPVLRGTDALWRCPACGHESTAPLEAGCPKCKAGADAKRADLPPDPPAGLRPRAVNVRPETAPPVPPSVRTADWVQLPSTPSTPAADPPKDSATAFDRWLIAVEPLQLSEEALLRAAFMAGGVWATTGRLPDSTTFPSKVRALDRLDLTNAKVRATVAAALRFYVENHLAYGTAEGELTAAEVTTLVAQIDLEPEKEE